MDTGSNSAGGMPYLSVYAATKAYIAAWSFGLEAECGLRDWTFNFMTLSVGYRSKQNRTAASLANPTARTFARAAIAKVGRG